MSIFAAIAYGILHDLFTRMSAPSTSQSATRRVPHGRNDSTPACREGSRLVVGGSGIGLARAGAGRKPSAAKPVVTAPPHCTIAAHLRRMCGFDGILRLLAGRIGPRDDGRGRVVDSAREAFAVHGRLVGTHDELCGWPRGRPRRDGASLARAMPSERPRPRRSFARIAISRSRLWPWASLRARSAWPGRSRRSCRSAPGR